MKWHWCELFTQTYKTLKTMNQAFFLILNYKKRLKKKASIILVYDKKDASWLPEHLTISKHIKTSDNDFCWGKLLLSCYKAMYERIIKYILVRLRRKLWCMAQAIFLNIYVWKIKLKHTPYVWEHLKTLKQLTMILLLVVFLRSAVELILIIKIDDRLTHLKKLKFWNVY